MEKQAKGSGYSDERGLPVSFFSSQSIGQLFLRIPMVPKDHEAQNSCFLIDGIDDAKAANARPLEPVEFLLEQLSTLRRWWPAHAGVGRSARSPTKLRRAGYPLIHTPL